MGVFIITTTWSVIAYLWLFVVLIDYEVKIWEACLTFGFFWILLIMAVSADIYRRKTIEEKEEARLGELKKESEIIDDGEKDDSKNM